MTAPELALLLTLVSMTAYALLAGADFGAGIWDLLAGASDRGAPRRKLIEHVIGPVWEANHVWLIFVLVLVWTTFPAVFAAIASTLWAPLTFAAFGIIGRGAAFAFRKAVSTVAEQRLFGAVFAASSVATPFFLGAAAGAVAGGRVPIGIAGGDPWASWLSPVGVLAGALSVTACAFLAATYLCGNTTDPALASWFRTRALLSGAVTGALALAGLLVAHGSAHHLFDCLTGRALPLIVVSVVSGVGALALVAGRRFILARAAAGGAVAALVWGWGFGQYPDLLPGASIDSAAAAPATVHAVLVTSLAGLVLLVPSMVLLLRLFRDPHHSRPPQ